MVRGIYYSKCKDHRLLSVEDIAKASHLAPQKVQQLISSHILPPASEDGGYVKNCDVLWFLIKNNMIIPPSLLPPGTGKILFITNDETTFLVKESLIDRICRLFAESSSLVLTESAVIGPQSDLTILTFCPNVVVIIVTDYVQKLKTTLDLLASMPNITTILLVDTATKLAHDNGLVKLPADVVMSCNISAEQLGGRLQPLFTA